MNPKSYQGFFTVITLLALLVNLLIPTRVLADEETPPPTPTEEVAPPETSQEDVTPPQDLTSEVDSVPEILEQLPENTEIVVLDESGAPIPLVTQEAAEIIVAGDPMWCPDGVLPGGVGCTPAFSDFDSGTGLLQYLVTNNTTYTGNGTIYIAYDYNPTTAGDGNVTLFGNVAFGLQGGGVNNADLGDLTVQGGWDFTNNVVNGQTNFGTNNLGVFNWNGNVTINNININGVAAGNGMNVFGNGDVELNNVTIQNSDFFGVNITNTAGSGDVTVNDSIFNNSTDAGLYINTNGNVNLSNITANDNGNNGASIDNSGGAGSDVNITGTNNFSNNDFTGIFVFSTGEINAQNITASNNTGFAGAILSNFLGNSATVYVTGTNVFNGNSDIGLGVFSDGAIYVENITANGNLSDDGINLDNENSGSGSGDVTLNNASASNNGANGIYIFTNGNSTTNNITANSNALNGLFVSAYGQINLNNITANQNGFAGVNLSSNNAGVSVINGQFNNNGFGGVGGLAYGNIYIENVISDGNDSGSGYFTSGTVTIKCSKFSNNTLDGMQLDAPELNLYGVTFLNNGIDIDDQTIGGSTINVFDYECNPSTGKPKPPTSGLPLNVVQGGSADLDCDKFSGTVLILPNGDKVTFKCPIGGSATLNNLANDVLPNALPEGMDYVSGMLATQSPDGSDVALDGLVVVSFIIPEDLKGSDFSILYWNGTEWLDLDEATFDDGKKVFNGGYVTEDGYFEALTNFSGNFVLVKK
jgi:hypothetical protein